MRNVLPLECGSFPPHLLLNTGNPCSEKHALVRMHALCDNVKITTGESGQTEKVVRIGNWVGLYLEGGTTFLSLEADITMTQQRRRRRAVTAHAHTQTQTYTFCSLVLREKEKRQCSHILGFKKKKKVNSKIRNAPYYYLQWIQI